MCNIYRKMWRIWLINALFVSVLALPGVSLAASDYSAAVSVVKVDDNLVTGGRFKLELRVSNNGVRTLSGANGVNLRLDSSSRGWSDENLSLGNQSIKPGETKKLTFSVTAPDNSGLFDIALVLVKDSKEISNKTAAIQIAVETRSNRVKFISQVVPENMKTGEKNRVIVQFKNEGRFTWSRRSGFRLGFYGKDKNVWNSSPIKLDEKAVIPPGQVASFRFELRAPSKAGKYPLQMRMLKGRKSWIGEPTPPLTIDVGKGSKELDAEFMHQTIPGMKRSNVSYAIFERGGVYPVTITFKNNGIQPWLPGIYQLVSKDKKSDLTWSVSQIDLHQNEVIQPGQIKSFSFKVFAPLKPGIYDFQWQLRKGRSTWLGDVTEKIAITVK